MMALYIPGTTECVGVIETSTRPASRSPVSYSEIESAPAMQPAYEPCLERCSVGQPIVGHDVRHADSPAGRQHALDLAEHGRLVCREVDHAVADDHVNGRLRQRHVLDHALQELDVGCSRLIGVAPGQSQHLVGHVQAEGPACGPDTARREQDVDPAA